MPAVAGCHICWRKQAFDRQIPSCLLLASHRYKWTVCCPTYFNHKPGHVLGIMNLLIRDWKVQTLILAARNKKMWNYRQRNWSRWNVGWLKGLLKDSLCRLRNLQGRSLEKAMCIGPIPHPLGSIHQFQGKKNFLLWLWKVDNFNKADLITSKVDCKVEYLFINIIHSSKVQSSIGRIWTDRLKYLLREIIWESWAHVL